MTATDNDERAEPGDVVVGIDDSPSSEEALAWAAEWARSMGARLRAVHIINIVASSPMVWDSGFPATAYAPDVPTREDIEQAISAVFRAAAPEPDWTLEFRDGPPTGRELVRASADARLLVVGTREHVGLQRLISGSVSHYCVTHATCPVAAIPPSPHHDERETVAAGSELADTSATGGVQ